MQWTKVKSAKDLALDGISIEVDRSDSSFLSATFTDALGRKVRVRYESYSLYVEIPATPETKEKFKVSGTIAGVPVSEQFDSSYAANNRKDELSDAVRGGAALAVESVQVAEEIPW